MTRALVAVTLVAPVHSHHFHLNVTDPSETIDFCQQISGAVR